MDTQQCAHHKFFGSAWTPEEDQFLLGESELFGFKSWKNISKRLNKHFPSSLRSFRDCRRRALYLVQEKMSSQPWTANEDFVLLFAYYKGSRKWPPVGRCLTKRRKTDIKARFYQLFTEMVQRIQSRNLSPISPFEQFKTYLCAHLAVRWLKSGELDKEAGKIISRSGITIEECLSALKSTLVAAPDKAWTEERLEAYVENLFELIENEMFEIRRSVEHEQMLLSRQDGPIKDLVLPLKTMKSIEYNNNISSANL